MSQDTARQPKLSVIVPVYNAEPYLRQCVDSILNQTFSDFVPTGEIQLFAPMYELYSESCVREQWYRVIDKAINSQRQRKKADRRGEVSEE